jgi:hypothetical protein
MPQNISETPIDAQNISTHTIAADQDSYLDLNFLELEDAEINKSEPKIKEVIMQEEEETIGGQTSVSPTAFKIEEDVV